jgi:hypothetical protein
MTDKRCYTCKFYAEDEDPKDEQGFCLWADDNPLPTAYKDQEDPLIGENDGQTCPCWVATPTYTPLPGISGRWAFFTPKPR